MHKTLFGIELLNRVNNLAVARAAERECGKDVRAPAVKDARAMQYCADPAGFGKQRADLAHTAVVRALIVLNSTAVDFFIHSVFKKSSRDAGVFLPYFCHPLILQMVYGVLAGDAAEHRIFYF